MRRSFLAIILFILLVTASGGAQAQTACTLQTQSQLLTSFADNVGLGAITPQTLRNFVCSIYSDALLVVGGTMTGELITNASSAGGAGLNIPQGTAPTSPVNGDIWTSSAGLFARINSLTVGPFVSNATGSFLPLAGGTMTGDIAMGTHNISGLGTIDGLTISTTTGTLTIANGKTLTDTSGVGASILLGTTGGGFTGYAGTASAGNVLTALSAAGAGSFLAYTSLNTASTLVERDASGNFSAGTITATVTGHSSLDLLASNNLSDIGSASTARANLGLGTMATQNAAAVAITGGTVSLPGSASAYTNLFVGAPVGQTTSNNWLQNFIASSDTSGPVYGIVLGPTTIISQVTGLNSVGTGGGYGVIGGAQSASCTAGCATADSFAVGAFAINNAQTGGATIQNVWSYFGIVTALPGAANVGSGYTQGIEQDIVNKGLSGQPGAAPQVTPYGTSPAYATIGQILASGSGTGDATEQSYEGPSSSALQIISNFAGTPAASGTPTWKTGIVISAAALTGGTGSDSDTVIRDAISLPRMAGINFWNSRGGATSPVSSIYSATTSASSHTDNIRFDDTGIMFETNSGTTPGLAALTISPAAGATCGNVFSNGSGLVLFNATGSATNCSQFYNAKGTGGAHSFQVNSSPVAGFSSGGLTVNVLAGSGSRPVCANSSGVLEAGSLSAGLVTCP